MAHALEDNKFSPILFKPHIFEKKKESEREPKVLVHHINLFVLRDPKVEVSMKVEILSRKLIKPATPTPPHLRSLKISSIDQLAPPTYVTFILYYHANGDENDGKRKGLQKSLSEILTLYYPLAGR